MWNRIRKVGWLVDVGITLEVIGVEDTGFKESSMAGE